MFFIGEKSRKIRENSGEISGKFREISEIPEIPGKFPRKMSGTFFPKIMHFLKNRSVARCRKVRISWKSGEFSTNFRDFGGHKFAKNVQNLSKFSRNFPKFALFFTCAQVGTAGKHDFGEIFPEFSGNLRKFAISGNFGKFREFRDFPPLSKNPFFRCFSTESRIFGSRKFGEIWGISGKKNVRKLAKFGKMAQKTPFFLINTSCSSLTSKFTWRENLTDDFFFFGKTKFHFFRNFKCVILSRKFRKKKRLHDFFTPMAPLLRRGGSVFLTFFQFKTQHLKWRENRVGESFCSTFI